MKGHFRFEPFPVWTTVMQRLREEAGFEKECPPVPHRKPVRLAILRNK